MIGKGNEPLTKAIMAVITIESGLVAGGAPVFMARDHAEQEKIALYLSRVLDGMVHDLGNGVLIIVNH